MDCPLGPQECPHSDGALRESEERFRSTFDNAAVGMAHVAPDGSWLRVNRRVCEIVGYEPEELLQITFQDITHPDDLEADLGLLQETVEGKRDNYRIDKRYFRKDGSIVWVTLTVGCVRKPDGEVDYFISVIQDVTEQKRMHRALAESEARFRAIQQISPDGFMICSSARNEAGEIEDFRCDFANPAAENLARRTGLRLVGRYFVRDTPADERAGMFEIYRAVVETGEPADGEAFLPLNPTGVWIAYSVLRIEDGFAVWFSDITERKRTELSLKLSEARLRAFQQTSPDGFMIFSSVRDTRGAIVDFRCEFANPAAASLAHMDVSEMIGHRLLEQTPVNRKVGLFDVYVGVTETGRTAQDELAMPMQDGTTTWFRYSAVKVGDGFAVSFSDITSRKQAELDLKESEARFRAVQQTTPDGFIIFRSIRDDQGRIVDFRFDYVNPTVEELTRNRGSNIIGSTMRERMPGNITIGAFDRYVDVVETGEPWQGELMYPRLAGDTWYRATAAKVEDGFAVSFSDITDEKKAESLLKERDQRLRSILNNVVAFIGLLSPEGVLLEINEPALHAAGLERDDVIGKYFWDTYWWSHDGDVRDAVRETVMRAAKGELVREDLIIRTAGDNRMAVDFQLAPNFDEYGNVVEIIPSGVDISDRKKAERHREMLVRELSHRVKNSLATVQTIASHTLREASDLDSFREAFVGRLMATISFAVAHTVHLNGGKIEGFSIRKEPKAHGTGLQIEGHIKPKDTVVITEDVVTTGGSTIKAIRVAREHGLVVLGVITLLDRCEENGRQNIEAQDVPVHSILTIRDFQ